MGPIRILYVSTSTTLGGAEKTLHTLATSIDKRQFEVAGAVSLKPKGFYAERLEAEGCAVTAFDGGPVPSLKTYRGLVRAVAQARPDVVHAFLFQAIQLARAVKRLGAARFKLVSSPRIHYRTRSGPSLLVDRWLRSEDDLLVAESDASRAYLQNALGYDPRKLLTIRNGIDPAPEPADPEARARIRRELGAALGDLVIGAVGRLDAQKGHVYLLEALAKLRVIHPVRGVILGQGPLRSKLEAAARELGIDAHVRFVGEQPDLRPWLAALDIFAQPSLWEGLPNALLEAMDAGLPVVATNVDGVPEAVADGATGLLCGPGDSQALYARLQDAIIDPALRRRLGEAARESVRERFKRSDMIAAYEVVYRRVAGKS